MVILVSSLLYLFPDILSSSIPSDSSSSQSATSFEMDMALHVLSYDNSAGNPANSAPSPLSGISPQTPAGAPDSALPATSSFTTPTQEEESSASLLATVRVMSDLSEVCLENTGPDDLHNVVVAAGGRTLGTISELVPGEKKVLALAGGQQDLAVSAQDPDGRRVIARVQYIPSGDQGSSAAAAPLPGPSAPLPAPQPASAPCDEVLTIKSVSASNSPLEISLSANKSEGLAGQIAGYRCIAKNAGGQELSEIIIHCGGRMASTRYLPPGKELVLEGAFAIENCTTLSATAEARDGRGNSYRNNTSLPIWMRSSRLNLSVSAPRYAHRGESIPVQIRMENRGDDDLAGLTVQYGWGGEEQIALLPAAGKKDLSREMVAGQSANITVSGRDEEGRLVYASFHPRIEVLSSSLQIQADPALVNVYPGQPAEVGWILKNTGQETLRNITLEGDGSRRILKELSAGSSVRMAAIYSKDSTSWINVTAKGSDAMGFETTAEAGVLIKAVAPGISIKLMPSQIEACPGEKAATDVLITNTGDDPLQDVRLRLNGSLISNLGDIGPGEFRVVQSQTAIYGNCSLSFLAEGRDSLGRLQKAEAAAQVEAVVAALKIFAGASPSAVSAGESCRISCTVANTGKVPLNSIFVISKRLGPLGNIDFLSPKRQMTIASEKTVNEELQDVITAEGFTEDRKPVRATFNLKVGVLRAGETPVEDVPGPGPQYDLDMSPVNITYGNVSFSFNLPEQEQTERQVSATIASDIDRASDRQNEGVLERIEGFFDYVERLLGLSEGEGGQQGSEDGSAKDSSSTAIDSESHAARQFAAKDASDQGNYELSIEGVKGSEHGAITILDVNAQPTQPAAGEPVKITVHLQCPQGVKSASVKYGLSDLPLTKQDMLNVDRVYDCPLSLDSGDAVDGYWSGTIPGRGAGVYMPLSVWIWDGESSTEGGPYLIHWSTVSSTAASTASAPSANGMLFIESTSVKGRGEVAIKDTIQGSTMRFNEKITGNGSISLETVRCIDRSSSVDNFTEKKDLVFTGGNLKGHQSVESPSFHGGMGAAVTERYNLTHVDRSETASVSSKNSANNTLSFQTEQAFNGTWNIQTKYAKFYKKIKADQQYAGSFQTQKEIKFADAGQRQ